MGIESEPTEDELIQAIEGLLDVAEAEGQLERVEGVSQSLAFSEVGPGSVLGDFELLNVLGQGGMGVVFEARQRSVSGRRVAVKVLHAYLGDADSARRFRREIAAISVLSHEGIVPIFGAGLKHGRPYYGMRFLEGVSAARLVQKLRLLGSAPTDSRSVRGILAAEAGACADASSWEPSYARWVARVGLQLAEALEHVREHHLVHRDVKPANVMITPAGRPVLVDFGLVRREEEISEAQTRQGAFLGTLVYCSPEQLGGGDVDTRSDVYSAGATLYELLTLRKPFEAPNDLALRERIERDPPAPMEPRVPKDLQVICACALAKHPAQRYATPGRLAHDLRMFLDGLPIEARPRSRVAVALGRVRRHPFAALSLVLLALLVAAGAIRWNAELRARGLLASGLERAEEGRALRAELERRVRAQGEPDDRRLEGSLDRLDLEGELAEIQRLRARTERSYAAARSSLLESYSRLDRWPRARAALADLAAERVQSTLWDHLDLLDPEQLRSLEDELEDWDVEGRYADLLDRGCEVRFSSPQHGTRLERLSRVPFDGTLDEAPVGSAFGGQSSLGMKLSEGSYLATFVHPGFETIVYPFVVRRRASYSSGDELPPRIHELELVREGTRAPGFVLVSRGCSLLRDDPPYWKMFEESFFIQEREFSFGEWLDVVNHPDLREKERSRLEPSGHSIDPEVLPFRTGPDGRELSESVSRDDPLGALSPTQMEELVAALNRVKPRPEGWYYSIPTRAEWMRAARGADARTFPFVEPRDWDKLREEYRPAPGDVSPFGARGMCTSMSELVLNTLQGFRSMHLFSGGSWLLYKPEQGTVHAYRVELNAPRDDGGLRLVLRRYPAWMRDAEAAPLPFVEEFDRPDGRELGGQWQTVAGHPLNAIHDPDAVADCSLRDSTLVCRGSTGMGSVGSTAWHRIRTPEEGYRVRATVRVRWESPEDDPNGRCGGILLERDFARQDTRISMGVDGEGRPLLLFRGHFDRGSRTLPPDRPLELEILVRAGVLEGRVWLAGASRPPDPTFPALLGGELPRPRFVGFEGVNLVGGRVQVERVSIEALD